MWASFMAMMLLILWSGSECKIFKGRIVRYRNITPMENWYGRRETAILKREVNLLDMLRTPLMLSFNRNNAFSPVGGRDKEYIRQLLESRKPQAFAERLYSQ
ncbi:unnamed protein product [Cylicocyclus nassatus]|uniref:Uncharacterized protein n=1 Tax=Cylicocyclus nassatus TaxID=53992 RepID=A0AA36M8V0_CYLNA|nr:unnamed protein product [Cylicocyclus nassatus]